MLLDRRNLLSGLPLVAPVLASAQNPASPAKEAKTRFYVMEQFFLENGSQPERIHRFLSEALLPKLREVHRGPVLVLEALTAPHMPQVMLIMGIREIGEVWSVPKALFGDPKFQAAFDAWEAGEPPYLSTSATLLEAMDYSPEIPVPAKPPGTRRIFELRTYHSPTARQAKLLHERFSGPEIKIFHRVGVHPVFYTETVFGAMRPNLTYLTPFASLAEREKAWNAFGADPEWAKVRKESIDRGGQISSQMQISLFRATAYSPVG